jgi:hypothetical protein
MNHPAPGVPIFFFSCEYCPTRSPQVLPTHLLSCGEHGALFLCEQHLDEAIALERKCEHAIRLYRLTPVEEPRPVAPGWRPDIGDLVVVRDNRRWCDGQIARVEDVRDRAYVQIVQHGFAWLPFESLEPYEPVLPQKGEG